MKLLKTYYDDDGNVIPSPEDPTQREFYRDYLAIHTFNEAFIDSQKVHNLQLYQDATGVKVQHGEQPGWNDSRITTETVLGDVRLVDGPYGRKAAKLVCGGFGRGSISESAYLTQDLTGKELRLSALVKSPSIDYYESSYTDENLVLYLKSWTFIAGDTYASNLYLVVSGRQRVTSYTSPGSLYLFYQQPGTFNDGLWHRWEARLNLSTWIYSILRDDETLASATVTNSYFKTAARWSGYGIAGDSSNYPHVYFMADNEVLNSVSEMEIDSFELGIL